MIEESGSSDDGVLEPLRANRAARRPPAGTERASYTNARMVQAELHASEHAAIDVGEGERDAERGDVDRRRDGGR